MQSVNADRDGNRAAPDQIRGMFDRLSPVYDRMNLLISGLQEPRWRRRAVLAIDPRPGMRVVDVACGTGTLSADLREAVAPGGSVLGVDFSPRMIELARRRHAGRRDLLFIEADALDLPLPDASFDAATIAFGMRNLADYARGFVQLRRVVRPGGRVVCLEIARPTHWLGRLAAVWFDRLVPLLGRLVGQREAYAYLVRSTRDYPGPERVAALMREAGLEDIRLAYLSGGMVTLHVASRPADKVADRVPI